MDQITADQLNTLAQQFLDIGNALLAFRENTPDISADDDAALKQLQNELLDKAGELATQAAINSGSEAADAVKSLTKVNAEIAESIHHLADVQKAIRIATAAINVVVSVISMNPGNIVDAVGGFAETCGVKL